MTKPAAAPADTAEQQANPNTVTLDTPLKRGESQITHVTLRKPSSGELRGIQLSELVQMQVDSLITVLPRISDPALTDQDVRRMDPADLMQLGIKVALFLSPKQEKAEQYPGE